MKKFIPIISFILLIAIHSQGQTSRNLPLPDGTEKIIKLYPNPATSYINFDFQKDYQKGFSIQVYNFLGKKMYENQELTERTSINLNDYNRGVYIYRLVDRGGRVVESGKFQVSK
ncbi:MAG TPA: T9SS type A sorting domain-containing protein [Chitinophagaceae bacterium]|nr:T9SS type A sorting domain-containing protein [Chitinophagaceae bacterium]